MNEPLVSIITPVYNAERFLGDTIKSIQNQTYKNWELVLVDDCSKDKSSDMIKEFQANDDRIRYIKLEKNSGASVSRNTGIKNAKGRFIAFVDSDDIWQPEKLKIQIEYMLENKLGFTFTSYRYMKEDGRLTKKVAKAPKKINYKGLLKNTIIGCSTVVIDKEIVGEFSMPLVRRGQDTATWLQILKTQDYAYGIEKDLVNYRLVGDSLSSNKIKALKRTWNTYRNVEKLSVLKSSYVFCFYVINAIRKRL
ncbi:MULTISPECIES: glycosyltransferase family 2 protein [Romboutsia]|uniref:Glycosyltransferase, group 2 protein n=2 Tax=Romboutsia hominis TaxID=1507512 RepID=A0A2P2BU22_9FIRM|nr:MULTISPECIES: glycosyltransferase family 2 protein [Romboutsia]MCH1961139.1 glycosyltransferase [Romboutsia hominis]MDB8789359.1 glycosyltransferase family 2 protein [Romboutsia sp. 1001216sp1]MDB8802067.1 glycosyltransferase family 2 protein [Romboutsia sp. 1001216sp1]MDB8804699.1 glycosyltransferase family 2 protein [Romboutsia sp. 1001216sp1]MDB8806377.1 glycosyltransferase family 2 protein [Romboutsia sp. 1001216sp1]